MSLYNQSHYQVVMVM